MIYLTLGCSACKSAHIQVYAGMSDFQHVVPVHAAEVRKRKRSDCPNDKEDLGSGRLLSDLLYFVDAMVDSNVTISNHCFHLLDDR